jgi:hypothetical protein
MTPHVIAAVLDVIRQAGHNLGVVKVVTTDGRFVWHVDATCNARGERWIVQAEDEYEALIELAQQVGMELEE